MTSTTIAPRIEFDLDHTGKPSRTPNHTGHGSHHWTAYALIHARGKTYRANVFQTGRKLATAELESMLYLNGRSIPETHLPELRAALLEAYRATFAMVPPQVGQSITVDHAWLRACGKTDWAGKAMEVTRIQPMPAQDEFMIHVIDPDGRPWSVWSIRGFEIAPAPIKLTSKPSVETIAQSAQDVERLKSKGEHKAAGALAKALGLSRDYGCHYGMKSDRAASMADFYQGFDAPKPSVETIDCTPTWAALVPALVAMIENGTPASRAYAISEIELLARHMDSSIAKAKGN